MASVDSSKRTGGNDLPRNPLTNLMERIRPSLPATKEPLKASGGNAQALLDEYAELAALTGFGHKHIGSNLGIESFKEFLRKKDWAVFSLPAVIAYMDKKAATESAEKSGWHWRPLREKDHIKDAKFGVEAAQIHGQSRTCACDYYAGARNAGPQYYPPNTVLPASSEPYDKLVPIHALRKVAAIEKEYGKPVSFFVCDYAPAPHIQYPDPFLMAVINNPNLGKGDGRFVIDFWDEPGFGLEEQLKG